MNKICFDENNIVFTFGAISDIHITTGEDDSEPKFRAALRQLKARAGTNGLDAMLVVGDLINTREDAQIKLYKEIYESELCPFVPMIYCLGDYHDLFWMDENVRESIKKFINIFGERYYETDVALDMLPRGNRHCVICGHHIIAMQPIHRMPIYYGDAEKEWLDRTLSEITAKEPDKHVFVINHPMIHDTCYGSTLGDEWDTSDITGILAKYPQVVVFGGHLHFPLNDERSIMQKDFTSVGCGSVRYMAIEGGFMFQRGYVVANAYRFSQGLLCEVDKNDNVRITRMDFKNEKEIKTPWTIDMSLDSYRPERAEKISAPYFDDIKTDIVYGKNDGGQRTCFLNFNAAKDADLVHHYFITVKNASGNEVLDKKLITDFFRFAEPCEMATEYSVDVGDLADGEYTVDITAVNSWGKTSRPASTKVRL